MSEKKTYGQQILDHQSKNLLMEDDIIEYRRTMEPDTIKQMEDVVARAKNQPLYTNKDFYVVILFKVERIGQAPRILVLARRSCPTPTYQQSVFKYHHSTSSLEFLWSIPSAMTYYYIKNNASKLLQDKEIHDSVKFVVLMESGELLEWVKKENGNKPDGVIKIAKENVC